MPPIKYTLREPMRSQIERLRALEGVAGVLAATISMGFPFADIHNAGVSVLVTTDGNREQAESQADVLAEHTVETSR